MQSTPSRRSVQASEVLTPAGRASIAIEDSCQYVSSHFFANWLSDCGLRSEEFHAAISRGGVFTAGASIRVRLAIRWRRTRALADPECFVMTPRQLSRDEFERVLGEALESLPTRFADLVENVVISAEDEPSEDDLKNLEGDAEVDSELLGIYRGVALTERTHDMILLPDEITVFRGPINRVSRTRQEAVQQVRETIIHELGHYFGLADDEMPE